MKNQAKKTYSLEEVRKSMDRYLDSSIDRLRSRLKTAWKKQAAVKPAYDRTAI